MQFTVTSIVCIIFLLGRGVGADYYWRYFGMLNIEDVIIGGWNEHERDFYFIGQGIGYLNTTYGEVPSKVTPSSQIITLAMSKGPVSVNVATAKVLCSSKSSGFKWLETSSATFWRDIYSNNTWPVIGGHEFLIGGKSNDVPFLLIGRYQEYIGKIVTGTDKPYMAYVDNNGEIYNVTDFEVFVTIV